MDFTINIRKLHKSSVSGFLGGEQKETEDKTDLSSKIMH